MIGRRRKDFDPAKLEALLADEQIKSYNPAFDYYDELSVCGFAYKFSPSYGATEFRWDQEEIDRLCMDFEAITGLTAKVWLTPWGY